VIDLIEDSEGEDEGDDDDNDEEGEEENDGSQDDEENIKDALELMSNDISEVSDSLTKRIDSATQSLMKRIDSATQSLTKRLNTLEKTSGRTTDTALDQELLNQLLKRLDQIEKERERDRNYIRHLEFQVETLSNEMTQEVLHVRSSLLTDAHDLRASLYEHPQVDFSAVEATYRRLELLRAQVEQFEESVELGPEIVVVQQRTSTSDEPMSAQQVDVLLKRLRTVAAAETGAT
jgi:hypothetical protein